MNLRSLISDARKLGQTNPKDEPYRSKGERTIAHFLKSKHIKFIYEQPVKAHNGFTFAEADFYLPQFDTYIEYWGLDTPSYQAKKKAKLANYYQNNLRLISLYPGDLRNLNGRLKYKLTQLTGRAY